MSSSGRSRRSARRCWRSATRCCGERSATRTPRSSPSGCSRPATSWRSRWWCPTIRRRSGRRSCGCAPRWTSSSRPAGLGPTEDDRTVDVVAELLATGTSPTRSRSSSMKKRFSTHGFEMTPNNLRQVRIPNGARALPNAAGIAPGFVVRAGRRGGVLPPGRPARDGEDVHRRGDAAARAPAGRDGRARRPPPAPGTSTAWASRTSTTAWPGS